MRDSWEGGVSGEWEFEARGRNTRRTWDAETPGSALPKCLFQGVCLTI